MIDSSKTKWDLSDIKTNFEEETSKIRIAANKFSSDWKNLDLNSANLNTIKSALDDYEKFMRDFGTTGDYGYYSILRFYENSSSNDVLSEKSRAEEFSLEIYNKISFFVISLCKIDESKQKEILESNIFNDYKHFLKLTFDNAKYILSEKEEKIMAYKNLVGHDNWENMVISLLNKQVFDFDKGHGVERVPFSEVLEQFTNSNKSVRDSAAKLVHEVVSKYSEVSEFEINSIIQNKKFNDEIRGFKRVDSSRILEDDISEEIMDGLVESVSSRYDIAKRYYSFKSKVLEVDKLEYYERNIPVSEINAKFDYPSSVETIEKVFSSLDLDFMIKVKNLFESGKVDVYPRVGKKGGAFCMHNLIRQPTYVLLNWVDSVRSLTTLAHELGHALNNLYMQENQNSLNFGSPKSIAEVSSIFFEDFVLKDAISKSDDETKFALLMIKIEDDINSVFRQIAFYQFERELHESFRLQGYLSSESIGKMFVKHMSNYCGESVNCNGYGNWWIYVPHFRFLFYVYSYSLGVLISKNLQKRVREDPKFIDKFKIYLSSGTSKSPKQLFLDLGIDISDKSFWLAGLDEINSLIDEAELLAKKLGKSV